MDERVQFFLKLAGPVLCVDIGESQQNAILARPGLNVEDWPRVTMPSRAAMIAQRVMGLTLLKKPVWLYGEEMGGGITKSLRNHIAAGLPVYATAEAALSIHNDQEVVENIGIHLTNVCPADAVPVYLCDYDPGYWSVILGNAGLPLPHIVLACARDHGFHKSDNRLARMQWWRDMINTNPDPINWIYEMAPEEMRRLRAIQSHTGGPVADSAVCSLLGALCDISVFERSCREGITIIVAGNAHTVAALVYKGKIYGIYEHHTDKWDLNLFLEDLKQFRLHWLPEEKARESGANGVAYAKKFEEAGGFEPTYILGSKRKRLENAGSFISPHGDMLHAACFGLLYGWSRSHAKV